MCVPVAGRQRVERGRRMRLRTATDLGLIIRERRRELGLTQEALAREVGASRQWISMVEKGRPRADLGLVLRALGALRLILDVRSDSRGEAGGARRDAPGSSGHPMDIDAVVRAARRGRR